jgi:hypothetical protein
MYASLIHKTCYRKSKRHNYEKSLLKSTTADYKSADGVFNRSYGLKLDPAENTAFFSLRNFSTADGTASAALLFSCVPVQAQTDKLKQNNDSYPESGVHPVFLCVTGYVNADNSN